MGKRKNTEIKVERRGGARPGAGRPPKNGVSRAKYRPVLIKQEAYELLAGVENKCEYVSNLIFKNLKKDAIFF